MERNLVVGQTIQFDIVPVSPSNATVEAYTAKYQVVALLEIVQEGVVEKSADNSHFTVKIDTSTLIPGKYEIRVMVTDTVDDFTDCPITHSIVLRR